MTASRSRASDLMRATMSSLRPVLYIGSVIDIGSEMRCRGRNSGCSPLYVAIAPLSLGTRKVAPEVTAARFLAEQRGLRDEARRLDHVSFFGRSHRQARFNPVEDGKTIAQRVRRSVDAGVVPHDAPNVVGRDLGRATVQQRWRAPHGSRRLGGQRDTGYHVARHALGENQSFEQRVGCQPVGAVYPRASNLATGVQPGNARPPREVCDDSAHHVMRRRRHRNQIRVWIDPTRNAERENTWEMLLERSFEPRCIEKYLTAGALLPEDRSSHDVPGRELGELVLPEHETVAAIVDQNGSFSTHGLRNERQRCLSGVECRWMEL